MSLFPVSAGARKALESRWTALGVRACDIEEQFVRSGGPGGQNVNKVSTCVVLVHRPTGTTVRCHEERTQGLNRYRARVRLAEKLEEIRDREKSEKQRAFDRIRRQKRRRSRRAREKILRDKHHIALVKAHRRVDPRVDLHDS